MRTIRAAFEAARIVLRPLAPSRVTRFM
ncbi:hypothetical protein M218_06630 [Burkholderia pseudomallei MSHR338]|nr:hypothetical protein M218_06630 [Burkholderia pseudomallei MSHR338]